jgi:hypothetical protein
MQHNSCHFRPIGTFVVSIEQAQIGDEMLVVIIGQIARRWGLIGNRGDRV